MAQQHAISKMWGKYCTVDASHYPKYHWPMLQWPPVCLQNIQTSKTALTSESFSRTNNKITTHENFCLSCTCVLSCCRILQQIAQQKSEYRPAVAHAGFYHGGGSARPEGPCCQAWRAESGMDLYCASYASTVLAVIVCLSIRLSVTSRSCTKTAKSRITLRMAYDSPETVVFRCQKSRRNSNDITPNRGAK